jgi:hypothetical protein
MAAESECGQHGGTIVRTVWLTSGAHTVSYFPELSKPAQTWKLEMDALPCSKNSQFLHVARLGPTRFRIFPNYRNQLKLGNSKWMPYLAPKIPNFSQLCRHPILNIIIVKNPRTDSTFESLMNFKRDLNLLEKSDKFSKIPS